MARKTKTPKGLTATRSGDKFTVSWKIVDKNHSNGQKLEYRVAYYAKNTSKAFTYNYTYLGKKKSTKVAKNGTYTKVGSWTSDGISIKKNTDKSTSFTFPVSNWYPNKNKKGQILPSINYIEFRFKGNCGKIKEKVKKKKVDVNPSWSDYAYYVYDVSAPSQPSISQDLQTWPSDKFSWSISNDNKSGNWVRTAEYVSVLVKKSADKVTDWSKSVEPKSQTRYTKTYDKIPANNGDGLTITEDSSILADGNPYTRWFKITAWGPGGTSSRTGYHVYSLPDRPRITNQIVTEIPKDNNYFCQLWYDSTFTNTQKPIKDIEAQYVITKPDKDMTCPSSASWQKGSTIVPKDETSGALFYIDGLVKPDECLFFRVNATYDQNTTNGVPALAEGLSYTLEDPEIGEISVDPSTYNATINATNKSNVVDSFLVIRYFDDGEYSDGIDIGVIPHGKSKAIVKCPEWSSESKKHFAVYAAVVVGGIPEPVASYKLSTDTSMIVGKVYYEHTDEGYVVAVKYTFILTSDTEVDSDKVYYEYEEGEYIQVDPEEGDNPQQLGWYEEVEDTLANPSEEGWYEPDDSITRYTIEPGMKSNVVSEGGNVPMAPSEVICSRTDISGTVRVEWKWDWENADSAELSWSDHIDAWESTDAPQTFEISKMKASAWNISNLEVGKTWYVRIRLISGTDNTKTYSPYSDITDSSTINLISAPLRPILTIPDSANIIARDGMSSLKWSYVPTDNTQQAFAKIFEVVGDNELSEITTIEGSATTYTIDPSPNGLNWNTGEQHTMVVQVVSESGLPSNYSNEQTITIADPINCDISSSSLVPVYNYSYTEISDDTRNDSVISVNMEAETFLDGDPIKNSGYKFDILSASLDSEDLFCADEINIHKNSVEYFLTSDQSIDPSKTYYQIITATEVDSPSDAFLDYYYEASSDVYSKTTDVSVVTGKTYYTIVTNVVESPEAESISTYYEMQETSTLISGVTRDSFSSYGIVSIPVNQETWDPESTNNFVRFDVVRTTDYELKEMPLDLTVSGAGNDGFTFVMISRAAPYFNATPDESELAGYEDETICIIEQVGEDPISIGLDNLLGRLDDTAKYVITANVSDSIGQVAYCDPLEFTVSWSHQPNAPTAEVTIDNEHAIAYLRPIAPEDAVSTDVCDIYRLSVDKPVLIYQNAKFGETYVDPYPTIGEYGGHRFVTKTANGDYISDNEDGSSFAWTDTVEYDGDIYENHANLIEFEDYQIPFLYEIDLSNSWTKDFKETQYLGGSVQGDWNKAVSRTATINGLMVSDEDQEMIQAMRRLAVYPGLCHVRSKDGSNYVADVQVNETYEYTKGPRLNKYDLSITRVDYEALDGVTYEEWQESNPEEASE